MLGKDYASAIATRVLFRAARTAIEPISSSVGVIGENNFLTVPPYPPRIPHHRTMFRSQQNQNLCTETVKPPHLSPGSLSGSFFLRFPICFQLENSIKIGVLALSGSPHIPESGTGVRNKSELQVMLSIAQAFVSI